MGRIINNLNPFGPLKEEEEEGRETMMMMNAASGAVHSEAGDSFMPPIPEGVDEANFNKMLLMRQERLGLEQHMLDINQIVIDMQQLSHFYKKIIDLQEELYEIRCKQEEDHNTLCTDERFDIEFILQLKQ